MDDRRGRWTALSKQFHAQVGPLATKILEDMIALLRSSLGDDDNSRYVQDQFLDFMSDKVDIWKQHPKLSTAAIDYLIDCLLLISNRNPSPSAARSMVILTQILTLDDRVFARFRPSKVNLMKLCLPLYIQGTDVALRKQALDFAVTLLTSSAGADIDDITTDPAVISKITWAERRRAWEHLRAEQALVAKLVERAEQHETALASLNRSVGRVDVTLDQLHSEIEALKTKSLAHDVSLNEQRRGAERSAELTAGLRASLEALDESLQQTNKNLRAHEDNIVLLNETSDAHEAALTQLGQSLRTVDAGVRQCETHIGTHSSMLRTIESNFAAAETALEQLRSASMAQESNIQRLTGEVKALQGSLTDVRAAAEGAEAAIESVAGANRELGAALSEMKAAVEAIDGAVSSLQSASDAEFSSLRGALKGHEAALHHLRVEAGNSIGQVKSTLGTLDESQRELRGAVDAQTATIARLATAQRALEDMHGVVRETQVVVAQLQESVSAHQGDLEKLNTSTAAHQSTLRDMLSATEAASQQIDAMQSTVEQLDHSVQQLWQGNGTTQATMRDMQARLTGLRTDVDRLSQSADSLTTAVRDLNESLHATDARARDAGQKADSAQQQAARRTMELAADIASLKRALDEHAALARRLSDATRDIDAILESMRAPAAVAAASAAAAASPAPALGSAAATSSAQRSLAAGAAPQSAEVVSRDAESRIRTLNAFSTDLAMKMEIVGWLARHSDWLAAERINAAVAGFLEYADANAQAVKKAPGPQTDAVRYVVDALRDPAAKRRIVLLSLLECLLRSDANILALHSLEGMDALVPLLQATDEDTLIGTLRCVRAAARNTHCIIRLRERDGLRRLVDLLRAPSVAVQEASASAVRAVTRLDDVIPDLLVAGAVEALAPLLQSPHQRVVEHAACALRNTARLDTSILAIQATGALQVLFHLLKSSSNEQITNACANALRACARNPKVQLDLHQWGALEYLGLRYPVVK